MFINYNKLNLNAFNDDIKHLHDNNMPITKYNSILWRAFNKHIPAFERVHMEKSLADLFWGEKSVGARRRGQKIFNVCKISCLNLLFIMLNWLFSLHFTFLMECLNLLLAAPPSIEFWKFTVVEYPNWAKMEFVFAFALSLLLGEGIRTKNSWFLN